MIDRLVRTLSMLINPIGYAVIAFVIVAFLIKRGIGNALTGATIAVVAPGLVLLWCITYMGMWISVSERNRQKFARYFLLFDLGPGLLGAVGAILYSLRA